MFQDLTDLALQSATEQLQQLDAGRDVTVDTILGPVTLRLHDAGGMYVYSAVPPGVRAEMEGGELCAGCGEHPCDCICAERRERDAEIADAQAEE
jgi:hypothetical protein